MKVSKLRMSQTGGASNYFEIGVGTQDTVYPFAFYWWEILGLCTWYSSRQTGFYFNNLTHAYMSTAHTHIYQIDSNADGSHTYHFSAKNGNGRTVIPNRTITIYRLRDAAMYFRMVNRLIGRL
jgi:hypothetical protein